MEASTSPFRSQMWMLVSVEALMMNLPAKRKRCIIIPLHNGFLYLGTNWKTFKNTNKTLWIGLRVNPNPPPQYRSRQCQCWGCWPCVSLGSPQAQLWRQKSHPPFSAFWRFEWRLHWPARWWRPCMSSVRVSEADKWRNLWLELSLCAVHIKEHACSAPRPFLSFIVKIKVAWHVTTAN